jgi:hypothetical protein
MIVNGLPQAFIAHALAIGSTRILSDCASYLTLHYWPDARFRLQYKASRTQQGSANKTSKTKPSQRNTRLRHWNSSKGRE